MKINIPVTIGVLLWGTSVWADGTPTTGPAAGADVEIRRLLDSGRLAQIGHDQSGALTAYQQAQQRAAAEKLPQLQSLALNNIATLYIVEKDYNKAINTLAAIPTEDPSHPDPNAYLYSYNHGRAEELAGKPDAALEQYLRSMQLKADFRLASDRIFALVISGKQDVLICNRIVTILCEHDQALQAADGVKACLQHAADRNLLSTLLRCYVLGGISPKRFNEHEAELKSQQADQGISRRPIPVVRLAELNAAPIAAAVQDVLKVYTTSDPDDKAWTEGLNGWKDVNPKMFSSFVKIVADASAREELPVLASAQYSAAFRLDENNVDAALYLSSILRNYHNALDPTGNKLGQLVDRLFNMKSGIYNHVELSLPDKRKLLQLHCVLGSIFDDQDWKNQFGESGTAVFQWSKAAALQADLEKAQPSLAVKPAVYAHYAQALEKLGNPSAAWKWYMDAGEGYLASSDRNAALATLSACNRLDFTPAGWDKTRLTTLSTKAWSLPKKESEQPLQINWLPPEYRKIKLTPDQEKLLNSISSSYDEKIKQHPEAAKKIDLEKRSVIDTKLSAEQVDAIKKVRTQSAAPRGDE